MTFRAQTCLTPVNRLLNIVWSFFSRDWRHCNPKNRPLHDSHTRSTVGDGYSESFFFTHFGVKQSKFVLFVSVQYNWLQRGFLMKTDIKKTSYENIRIKVSILFPSVSFPSTWSRSASWRRPSTLTCVELHTHTHTHQLAVSLGSVFKWTLCNITLLCSQ